MRADAATGRPFRFFEGVISQALLMASMHHVRAMSSHARSPRLLVATHASTVVATAPWAPTCPTHRPTNGGRASHLHQCQARLEPRLGLRAPELDMQRLAVERAVTVPVLHLLCYILGLHVSLQCELAWISCGQQLYHAREHTCTSQCMWAAIEHALLTVHEDNGSSHLSTASP